MIILSKEQILQMHSELIRLFGGESGIRDESLLDSAIQTPFQSFDGSDLYPTIQAKAARLGFGLIMNHCMVDGNKRIGAHVMLVFLELNGFELSYSQKDLYSIILDVASGEKDDNDLLDWIIEHER